MAGTRLAGTATPTPTSAATASRAGSIASPDSGRPKPAALIERVEPGREADADEHTRDRGGRAHDETLRRRRHRDLSPRRTERTQQRRLARALRGHHRECVVDAERCDQECDRGEHEQHRLEEADERAVDVGPLLGGQLRTGDGGRAGRQRGLETPHELAWRHAGLGADQHAGDVVAPAEEQRWASAVVNAVKVVPAMLSELPNLAMPTTSTFSGRGTSTVVVLPTWRSPRPRRARSITTSPAAAGRGRRPPSTG